MTTLLKRTTSRCPECLASVPADVGDRDGRIVMTKTCPSHGIFESVIAADSRFYYLSSGAGDAGPSRADFDTFERLSTCVALIEIVDACNLRCPTCYADSPHTADASAGAVPFEEFARRVQGVIDRKGTKIDVLQLSGGEPTIHPEFFRLLDWALVHEKVGYVLVNTNGVRIATDRVFREDLGRRRRERRRLELYVQFDGPEFAGQVELRGADLRRLKVDAVDKAGIEAGVPSTLAMTVNRTNLPQIGAALRFGLERPHCRGITFQPVFGSGRGAVDDPSQPIGVADILRALEVQSAGLVTADDFTPLPCGDPNCHTIGYVLRTPEGPVPLGRLVDLANLQGFLRDRVDYDLQDLARCGCETEPLGDRLRELEIGPDHPFRIFVKPFMDAWTFDQDRIDRCCTHVIRPDGRLDSFCRYYLERARG